jgi:hypothetical protein
LGFNTHIDENDMRKLHCSYLKEKCQFYFIKSGNRRAEHVFSWGLVTVGMERMWERV